MTTESNISVESKVRAESDMLALRLLASRKGAMLAAVYGMYAILCTQLPLLNTLGYEFAVATGLVSAWASAPFVFHWARRLRRARAASPLVVLGHYVAVVAAQLLLLSIPMAILLVNALLVRNCDVFGGFLFYLLIPITTVLFSTALAMLLEGLLKKWKLGVYYFILCMFLLQPFVQIFTRPQLFSYNHVFGMFAGLSWDASQPPFFTLFLYRLSTLSYVALMISALTAVRIPGLLRSARVSVRILSVAVFAGALCAVLFFQLRSNEFGFDTSPSYARRVIGSVFRSEHFELIYSKDVFDEDEIERVAELHEYRLWQVRRELEVDWNGTITSYLYPTREIKRRLLGSETTQLARPWVAEVHLASESWRKSLKHELVHVVAGEFAPYINKAPFLRDYGLTEGLAMAVEWEYGNRTLHQYAAGMLAAGMLPGVERFMSTAGFLSNNTSLSYVASGSFCRWMIDSLGLSVVKNAYARDDLVAATGKSYEELDEAWRLFLGNIERDAPDELALSYSFRGASLLRKVCPRVLSEMNRNALHAYREGEYEESFRAYAAAEKTSPNRRSVYGMMNAQYQLGRYDSVLALTGRYLADSSRAYSLLPMYLWQGAAAVLTGDSLGADRAWSLLAIERPAGWPTETALRYLRILRSSGVRSGVTRAMAARLRRSGNNDSLRAERIDTLSMMMRDEPGDDLLRFELALLLSSDSESWDSARTVLQQMSTQGERFDADRLLGILYYHAGSLESARRVFSRALNVALQETQRLELRDWLARCDWKEKIFNRGTEER